MTVHMPAGTVVWPEVLVGEASVALSGLAESCLVRAEVDAQLRRPTAFALTFQDVTGTALDDAGLRIGAQVQIAAGTTPGARLVVGEVTAVEGTYAGHNGRTTVRGYDLCHRLQRARRSRTFDDVTDADVARRIAQEAHLRLGEIIETVTVHQHLLQCNQTDWEFLDQRACEIGYEFGIVDGRFTFRKAATLARGESGVTELTVPGTLLRFEPRVTAGNLTPDVEVRVWDPLRARLAATDPVPTSASTVSAPHTQGVAEVRALFKGPVAGLPAEPKPQPQSGRDVGPAPSPTAHVVGTVPVSDPDVAAAALAASVGATFAEAEGEARGDAAIRPGATVKVTGVPGHFPATWLVTRARHVFDPAEGGYRTEFSAGGGHDRTLLGLASGGPPPAARIPGPVCAIVDDIGDGHARVRLTLPWLSPDVRTDWAPVVQFGAGARSGAMFLPEVGDQVLVGFEFGDPRRPYVLGGLVTEDSAYSLGGEAVRRGPGGADSSVARRGFVSASGNRLVFFDEMGEDPKPQSSQILLGTGDGVIGLVFDAVKGTAEFACAPESPPGQLTVKCGPGGTVNIVTGEGGTVTIDGGDSLTLKSAASLTIQSKGTVSVSGASISLGG